DRSAIRPQISRGGQDSEGAQVKRSALKKPSQSPPPPFWRDEIQMVLLHHELIKRRVRALARQIQKDFAGRDLVVVAILNGTVMFLADLIRNLSLPLRLDFVGVSSYRQSTKPSKLIFTKELRLEVRDRDVLLVDDILDSGNTLRLVLQKLR